ncbi:MAG: UvrD-helicase domain-containing protein [Anaerolineae bacterium]|nr:UvrD-helicase domain-containing protein [Anaerolineae bacterium]MCO5192390.1 UvrD-helicase domain-containing protein [Anaerolineae bacterium]
MDLLHGLNPAQRAAVSAEPGPILVLAGPGSGKTRVLTHRIAYLVTELGVAPWHIMAVTFTNKAAREMRERIEKLMGGSMRGVMMGTFHSSCVRILRREVDHLVGYDRNFVIFDSDDQKQVVKQALKDLNLDDKRFQPAKMLSGISTAKSELVTAEQYEAANYVAEITKRVYKRYQEILIANNAMDFDDLLLNTVLLFDGNPDVLRAYQERYQHILVDEFQDTNSVQYELVKRLSALHQHIFVVGDADQSIYKWRGADFRNIRRFEKQFPGARQILLEQNYRSTQLILDAAKAVIKRNSDRVHKELFTERRGGERLVIHEAYNESDEGQYVVDSIAMLTAQGREPGDVAVMYRTNAQSRALEEAFIRAGLPYRLVGAQRFYGRREVKDVIAYLRLIHNPRDDVSFGRIINVPKRAIGRTTQMQIQQYAQQIGFSSAEAVMLLAGDATLPHPFSARAFNALSHFGNLLNGWVAVRDAMPVGELLDLVLEQTDYRSYIDDDTPEGASRWENVIELRGVASEADDTSLADFLEQVALVADADRTEGGPNAPTLLTLHAAKGLEFPIVFITGVEDGILPHSRSLDDMEEMAEERRLFYVGLTRAEDRVYLTRTFRRTLWGNSDVAVPSRFLQDLPADVVESAAGSHSSRQQSQSRMTSWNWSNPDNAPRGRSTHRARASRPTTEYRTRQPLPPSRSAQPERERQSAPIQAQFKTGQRVRHGKFGEGIVIESKLTGNDEEVTVAFSAAGIKRLAASFAKLELLE